VYKSAADVTREDIVKRHRKLMMINHPDNSKRERKERGREDADRFLNGCFIVYGLLLFIEGSMYISTKINEAKEVLLKQ
jgi:hypothetical protein